MANQVNSFTITSKQRLCYMCCKLHAFIAFSVHDMEYFTEEDPNKLIFNKECNLLVTDQDALGLLTSILSLATERRNYSSHMHLHLVGKVVRPCPVQ